MKPCCKVYRKIFANFEKALLRNCSANDGKRFVHLPGPSFFFLFNNNFDNIGF